MKFCECTESARGVKRLPWVQRVENLDLVQGQIVSWIIAQFFSLLGVFRRRALDLASSCERLFVDASIHLVGLLCVERKCLVGF